jgi:hypothetical protein
MAALMVLVEFSAAILTFIRSVQTFRIQGRATNKEKGFMFFLLEQGMCVASIINVHKPIISQA